MRSTRLRSGLGLALALWTAAPSCSRQRESPGEELRALVPHLEPELATHLATDSPREFRAYARTTGSAPLVRLAYQFLVAPPTGSIPEFLEVESRIAPAHQLLVEGLVDEFGVESPKRIRDAYWCHSTADRMEIAAVLTEITQLSADNSIPTPIRAARIEAVLDYERFPDIFNKSDLYAILATLLEELRRGGEVVPVLERGIEEAIRAGDVGMQCHLLGVLGTKYQNIGDDESMRRSWNRGLELARHHSLWQEARFLSFFSAAHRHQGQVAITRDLILEARDRCRSPDAAMVEPRFMVDALHFFSKLGCWDVVGRGLDPAQHVLAERRRLLSSGEAELEETRLQVLRAGHRASIGQCREARRLALEAARRVGTWSLGERRAVAIRLDAADVLMMCADAAEARPLLEWCVERSLQLPFPPGIDRSVNDLAAAYLALGELDSCRTLLASAAPAARGERSLRRAVLELRLAVASGDRRAAFAQLQTALVRLDEWTAAGGGSVDDDIALATHDELRQIGHELLENVPEAAYGFEMRWRTPARRGARFAAPGVSESSFVADMARSSREICVRLAAESAIHCVYDIRDDTIVRFTAGAGGVVEDRLEVDPRDLRAQVEEACDRLARPVAAESTPDRRLAHTLGALGRSLLPETVRSAPGPELVLVTTNGWLNRLPFEALGVDPNGNEPLLLHRNVARVRSWASKPSHAGADSALVVWEPEFSDALRRRYSILAERLPSSAEEATFARGLLPSSIGLTGRAATKQRVLAAWEGAPLLYFASHLVQDPDVPWVTFLPMARSPQEREDDSYLEASDVRRADLSRCGLAVLSSCASGAPYSSGRIAAPSLADAFLDAGVHAVVSTGWAVRDADAERIMRDFMREVVERDVEPIAALCGVRRALARAGAPPHAWAAFSISTGAFQEGRVAAKSDAP